MSYEVRANPVFEIDKERLLKSRPLAHTDIAAAFVSLRENPRQADRMPGIGALDIRKARWPLKSYRIGSSGGLRIVFALRERVIIPLAIWQTGNDQRTRCACSCEEASEGKHRMAARKLAALADKKMQTRRRSTFLAISKLSLPTNNLLSIHG
jgi:hypothetical protein